MPKATTLRSKAQRGFTLVELMVVILIVGILAAFAVPQYQNSMEISKAENAAAMLNMVATANRMYALDHGGLYMSGVLGTFCSGETCPASSGYPRDPCNLVSCKYLAASDFDRMPYEMMATGSSCYGYTGIFAACAMRRSNYTTWGYTIDKGGVITARGGAPTPTQ